MGTTSHVTKKKHHDSITEFKITTSPQNLSSKMDHIHHTGQIKATQSCPWNIVVRVHLYLNREYDRISPDLLQFSELHHRRIFCASFKETGQEEPALCLMITVVIVQPLPN